MSARILVVEDEPAIAETLAYALEDAGYDVDAVDDGTKAIEMARARPYDLMVLDLLLPGTPGMEVCRTIRRESALPIVMLTARADEADRIVGLEVGADDYVTKPYSVAELVSRVRALLRRRELDRRQGSTMLTVGDLQIDVTRHAAMLGGKPLQLTRSEFRLMSLFASEPGRVFSRDELVEHLWEGESGGDRRAIDVHISNLRRKLEDDPRNPQRLLTVRGSGYVLPRA